MGVVEEEEEKEEEEEEEEQEEGLVELLVKGAMEGVGHFLLLPLFRASMLHPRTDAPSSSVTRRPCGMVSLGWTAAKWAAML